MSDGPATTEPYCNSPSPLDGEIAKPKPPPPPILLTPGFQQSSQLQSTRSPTLNLRLVARFFGTIDVGLMLYRLPHMGRDLP